MKKGRPDEACFLDMKRAMELALAFTKGTTREQFDADLKGQSAVIYQLAVLGEAAKKVSDSFQEAHPGIPWKKMAGLRNILIHAYHGIDLDVIWKIVSIELPPLLRDWENL